MTLYTTSVAPWKFVKDAVGVQGTVYYQKAYYLRFTVKGTGVPV